MLVRCVILICREKKHFTAIYCRFCSAGADWLPFTKEVHIGAIGIGFCYSAAVTMLLPETTALTALPIAGNICCIIMFGGPLASIKTVLKDKSTESMPFGFTCLVLMNCSLWAFYAYWVIADPWLFVPNAIGVLLAGAQVALFVRFGIHR